MIIVILASIFVGVVLVFAALYLLMGRERPQADRLLTIKTPDQAPSAQKVSVSRPKQRELSKRMAEQVLQPLSRLTYFSSGSESKLVELLVYAGIRRRGAAEVFLGAKAALALALPAAAAGVVWWLAKHGNYPLDRKGLVMYCCIGLAAGLVLPNVWLRRKVKARQQQIRFALPDALDLLVVCVESGLALDAALIRLSREMQDTAPQLAEELSLMNLEVSAGKPRDECLRNLGLRTGVEEVRSLTARIIQTTKFGTNLAHSLRIHAESLRQKRRQEAEERAAKTTVKLIFPLVFFVFPAIFVVILGPALVNLKNLF
jgi:tight adherence protein C